MLNRPLHVLHAKHAEQLLGEIEVRDFVARVDIVDLPNLAPMQDGVEGICGVARVQEPSGVVAVAMDLQGLIALKQIDEFRDDLRKPLALSTRHDARVG